MLVDINPNLELPKFRLSLCRRNGDEITEIENLYDKIYDRYFAEIDELRFKVPKKIFDTTNQLVDNPVYDLIKGGFLVKVNEQQMFIINEITENDSEGEIYKQVNCFSREFELSDKIARGYRFDARKIYVDPLGGDPMFDENGFHWGVLNYIETLTTWRVNYVNPSLLTVFRGVDISEANLISMIQNLQVSFDCLFQFDTINRQFNVYKLEELGQNKGLYITDKNYINSLNKNIKFDEIKTRLYLYGQDNVSIERVNMSGQAYIENFDFFKTTEYMSQGLIDALDNYETFLSGFELTFAGYLADLETEQVNLSTAEDELFTLFSELNVLNQNKDIAISAGDDVAPINAQISAKMIEINEKLDEVDGIQDIIDDILDDINQLRQDVKAETFFTTSQLEELDPFIRDEVFSDSSYSEGLVDDLYEYGLELLGQISQPKYQFEIDVVNFLKIIEAQFDWEKMIVGDIANIQHSEIDNNITEIRLIHFRYNEDENRLNLSFSNRNNINDPFTYSRDLLTKLSATSTSVDFSKYGWDKAPETSSKFTQYVENSLDLARQAIIQGDNQAPILDDRGLWLRKRNPDMTYDPNQIRAVNNVIALTKDNWDTVSVAITPDGIVAEKIYGILGQFAEVRADSIILGGGGGIPPDVLEESDVVIENVEYNGVTIDKINGVRVSTDNGLARITLDATKGILIESRPNTSVDWSDNFFVDTNGKIVATNIVITGSNVMDFDSLTDGESSVTTITEDTISTTNVTAENLVVKTANITGSINTNAIFLESDDGKLSIQTNQIEVSHTDGSKSILNPDGLKVEHSEDNYSIFDSEGFKRFINGEQSPYRFLSAAGNQDQTDWVFRDFQTGGIAAIPVQEIVLEGQAWKLNKDNVEYSIFMSSSPDMSGYTIYGEDQTGIFTIERLGVEETATGAKVKYKAYVSYVVMVSAFEARRRWFPISIGYFIVA